MFQAPRPAAGDDGPRLDLTHFAEARHARLDSYQNIADRQAASACVSTSCTRRSDMSSSKPATTTRRAILANTAIAVATLPPAAATTLSGLAPGLASADPILAVIAAH